MEELTNIVIRLRNALADKEIEINDSESAGADEYSLLDNRKREINIFENRTKEVDAATVQKAAVIASFEEDARRIEAAIKHIGL